MKKNYFFLLLALMVSVLGTAQTNVELHQIWENGEWKNHLRYTPISLTPNNLAVVESLTESWNDQSQTWRNHERKLNTYMLGDILIESVLQQWNPATSQWVNEKLELRDPTQALHVTTQTWDGNAWQNQSMVYTETFNPTGLSVYIYQIWNSGQWENDARVTYESGEQIRQIGQNGDWVNETRYVWDTNGQTFYDWVNDQWEPTKRTTLPTEGITLNETYDSATQTWVPESQQIETIETIEIPEFEGEVLIATTQLYTGGAWTNSSRIIIQHDVVLGNPETAKPMTALYPNPTNSQLYLQNYAGDYAIFTIDGRQVGRGLASEPQTMIDVNGLQSGVYLIRMANQTLRFIKQ